MLAARALLLALLPVTVPLHAADDPRSDYLMHCSGCHLPDGSGYSPVVPTLQGVTGRMAGTAAGRDYLVRVPGVAQAPVSDATLTALLNWMLVEFSGATLPVDFQPLTVAEVAESRRVLLANPQSLRAKLFPDI
jgi:hypothetical protein